MRLTRIDFLQSGDETHQKQARSGFASHLCCHCGRVYPFSSCGHPSAPSSSAGCSSSPAEHPRGTDPSRLPKCLQQALSSLQISALLSLELFSFWLNKKVCKDVPLPCSIYHMAWRTGEGTFFTEMCCHQCVHLCSYLLARVSGSCLLWATYLMQVKEIY